MKDSNFYNQESVHYSRRRYPVVAQSYTQFFFKRRLALTENYIAEIVREFKEPSLLEVGCADGVVVRALDARFPERFSALVGIDIASEMIEEARRQTTSTYIQFFTRDRYVSHAPVDIVVETGVVNYANFDEELAFAYEHMNHGGYYVLSVAGTGSLLNLLKPEGGFNDFRSYRTYDRLIREKFLVQKVRGCGFFIPYLWHVPALARPIQAAVDTVLGVFVPGLCHEKVYLLKKK